MDSRSRLVHPDRDATNDHQRCRGFGPVPHAAVAQLPRPGLLRMQLRPAWFDQRDLPRVWRESTVAGERHGR